MACRPKGPRAKSTPAKSAVGLPTGAPDGEDRKMGSSALARRDRFCGGAVHGRIVVGEWGQGAGV